MNYLHKSELEIDRKMLADIAANHPEKFSNIVKTVIPN
jgi:ribosomal protein L20